jgi:hypothetical protein
MTSTEAQNGEHGETRGGQRPGAPRDERKAELARCGEAKKRDRKADQPHRNRQKKERKTRSKGNQLILMEGE